jgi:hypothetical protein
MVMSPKRVWKVRAWPEEQRSKGWPQTGQWGGGVGFGMGDALDGFAQEVLGVVEDLGFDVAEVLIGGVEEADDGGFQGDGQASG